jgi:hypothetical protein
MGNLDDDAPVPLPALENEQVAAFRAFQRPRTFADAALSADPDALSALGPDLNADLSRRVYAGREGTIDLVPGPGRVCCIVTVTGTGERISGTTWTELAAHGAHGFTSGRLGEPTLFRGVLSTGVRSLRIVTASEDTVTAVVNADDAYWMTISDPVTQTVTLQDGTEQLIPLSRFRLPEPPAGPV